MKLRKDIVNRVIKELRVDTKNYRYIYSETDRIIAKYRIKDLDTINAFDNVIYYDITGNEICRMGNVW